MNNVTNTSKRNSCDNFLFFTRTQKNLTIDKFDYRNQKKNNNNKTRLKENHSEKNFLNIKKSFPSTKNRSSITENKDNNSEEKGNNNLIIKVNRQRYLSKLKK